MKIFSVRSTSREERINMKYEAHMVSEVGTSRIPLKVSSDDEAKKKFKSSILTHGDQSILKLKLMRINGDKEEEIKV